MWRVLAILAQRKTCSAGELSDAAAIAVTALSRLVGKMEREGMVVRRRSPSDARIVEVTLTARGRSIARRLIPRALTLERRVLATLSATQTRVLRDAVAQIYVTLREELKEKTRR
jgi:DNA-binding MarR family transcriptional regulator